MSTRTKLNLMQIQKSRIQESEYRIQEAGPGRRERYQAHHLQV